MRDQTLLQRYARFLSFRWPLSAQGAKLKENSASLQLPFNCPGYELVMRLRLPVMINPRLGATALLLTCLAGSAAHGETLPLDPKGSSLTFTGEALLHNFRGEAKEFEGNAVLEREAVPPIQRATLHFKTAALTTFHEPRDQNMRTWLNIKVNPEATFQLESVKVLTGDYKTASPAQPAKFAVFGTLTLNAVKQPLSGTAQGWRENDRVIVAGETTVDTMKHGLPQIREMVLTVGKNVKTAFRFSFVLPSDYAMGKP
jgi:polyisoprenoid-binding protein YceI